MKKVLALVLTVLMLTVCSVSASAYESPSLSTDTESTVTVGSFTFVGRVVDAYGNALAGVTVTLSDGRTVTTDSNGYFRFNDLASGAHTVTVTDANGSVVSTGFNLSAGSSTLLNGTNISAVDGGLFSLVLNLNGSVLQLSDIKNGDASLNSGANGTDTDSEGSSANTSSNKTAASNNSATATSPKTGNSETMIVLLAAAALAFGGVAFTSKKKLDE